ncbi:hypothetical protein BH09BAC3_BH09BAC3_24730 [soil metagenome]
MIPGRTEMALTPPGCEKVFYKSLTSTTLNKKSSEEDPELRGE